MSPVFSFQVFTYLIIIAVFYILIISPEAVNLFLYLFLVNYTFLNQLGNFSHLVLFHAEPGHLLHTDSNSIWMIEG